MTDGPDLHLSHTGTVPSGTGAGAAAAGRGGRSDSPRDGFGGERTGGDGTLPTRSTGARDGRARDAVSDELTAAYD